MRSNAALVLWNWTRYIQKEMFVEVGKDMSPSFQQILELLLAKGEYLAFAPDTEETETMINLMSMKFPLLKVPTFPLGVCGHKLARVYHCYSPLSLMICIRFISLLNSIWLKLMLTLSLITIVFIFDLLYAYNFHSGHAFMIISPIYAFNSFFPSMEVILWC